MKKAGTWVTLDSCYQRCATIADAEQVIDALVLTLISIAVAAEATAGAGLEPRERQRIRGSWSH
ncbi:hypothetical protein ELI13_35875 [Rhizobium ruizarguesonis]|uniref:Uncharacterized protein n=1 Tax=Rhizobium ruizarguesonis TaxID=2081791 RepID=A0ABY1WW13_9HYPH|nr:MULTISPECIES: hypothetical protein [Rhizobium]MBY5454159.1 hypothetical protein [Rhizobium leguminosarum]TAU13067.1 hypothetical protein ELI48_37950 [Rhizobium ruizarguesonis]TAU57654.1 hypothetical protein ELI45_36420 [Rhizobium ruizarguesonis]TAV19079.1 hypothetical protein ELI36_37645 [Rhizobium ruizarguesonis]TAW01964.1 hypothetical protein ELI26_38645 [Rhizobium ruizarguesonis]